MIIFTIFPRILFCLTQRYSTAKLVQPRNLCSSSLIIFASHNFLPQFFFVFLNSFSIDVKYMQPTTDRFIAVVHGEDLKTIKGNALTGVSDLPFAGLSVFGSGFLNKFAAAVVPAPLLKGTCDVHTNQFILHTIQKFLFLFLILFFFYFSLLILDNPFFYFFEPLLRLDFSLSLFDTHKDKT